MEFFFNYHKIKTRINCYMIKTHMYFVLTVTGSKPHTFCRFGPVTVTGSKPT